MSDIEFKLNLLYELENNIDNLQRQRQEQIGATIPVEVALKVQEIENEFGQRIEMVTTEIVTLKKEVTEAILRAGTSCRGIHYLATWNKGRVTWDGKKLEGMMSIIPAIKDARKEGEPTVSFRKLE